MADKDDVPRAYGESLDVRKEIRIDTDMEERAKHHARRRRLSFGAYLRQALLEQIRRDDAEERADRRDQEDDS